MTKKRGVLSRADLVKTLANPDAVEWVADNLFLVKQLQTPIAEEEPPEEKDPDGSGGKEKEYEPVERPKAHFWRLSRRVQCTQNKQENTQIETPKAPATEVIEAEWPERPTESPKHIPLLDENALLAKLLPFLKQTTQSRKIDLNKVVKTISHGEHLSRIPRKHRKRQQRHLHIIDDRSRHLTPYWTDHDLAKLALLESLQGQNISFSVLIEGDQQPQQLTAEGLGEWECPEGSLVFVLGDLGVLQQYSTRNQQTWEKLGFQLTRLQCEAVALLPCPIQNIPPYLNGLFHTINWQEGSASVPEDEVVLLLSALAPCIRLEPSLLRQMRLALGLSVEMESLIWQHPAIQSPHSVAASWDADFRREHLKAFFELSDAVRNTAIKIIKAWREPLDKQIWYEEVIGLGDTNHPMPLLEADSIQAQAYFSALSEQFQDDVALEEGQHTQAWCRRVLKRIPKSCLSGSPALQRIAERVHKDDPEYDSRSIDPQNLRDSSGPLQQAVLYQQGNSLCLKPYAPHALPEKAYSHVALIQLRRNFVQITQGDQELGSLQLNEGKIPLVKTQALTVKSDQETLILETLTLPDDSEIGRDVYGLFVDKVFSGITQRFRYIEPTTFMMGSPENEKERYGDEDHHQVTLSQGYWLADTTCTQALWQAVMGEKPSDFKETPETPVENVSWLDVQRFITKLKQKAPELPIQLPSEAQWENACRSGTQAPFSFGENITPEQVNYNGKKPYAGGEKGEYREKTVPVKSLPPNPWGLYEMHGNVLEWCFDEWKENLGTDAQVDPVQAQFKSGVKPAPSRC